MASEQAGKLGVPLLVAFGITDDYPEANLRHYRFLAEGLRDVSCGLARRGIAFVVRCGQPAEVAIELAREAAFVVCDGAYLRQLRAWRRRVAEAAPVSVAEVETDIVVPVEVASNKREYAARTIRKKVMSRLDEFAALPQTHAGQGRPAEGAAGAGPTADDAADAAGAASGAARRAAVQAGIPPSVFENALDPSDPSALCDALDIDRSVEPVSWFLEGGERAARGLFEAFVAERAHLYAENRNEPATSDTSYMSAYLHFGHISPVHLVHRMRDAARLDGGVKESLASFVEELVVRRELSQNYVYFEPHYDSYGALPEWARSTLSEHAPDERPARYSLEELEHARTHDEYWNAAMREMLATGYMHNYMRMYWGKKILEWTEDPAEAFRRTLYLNNRYFLDGRDPASYANVAWVYGLHDRPWPERDVYGKVRTMKASGLERKCDMKGYIEKVRRLEEEAARHRSS
jgi:deoxyribodipyrimidine photo-lyase